MPGDKTLRDAFGDVVRAISLILLMFCINSAVADSVVSPSPTAGSNPSTSPQPTPATAASPLVSIVPYDESKSLKIIPGSIGPFKIETGEKPGWWTYLIPALGPLISGVLAYAGVRYSLDLARKNNSDTISASLRTNEAALWQKANETELKELTAKIDGFYGPFMQMSQANHLIIEEFRSRQPQGFRTLIKIFDKTWFDALPEGDRKIVAEVSTNAASLEKFIAEKAGMVDTLLLPYLARASAHFRILNLAYRRELGADPTNFAKYVYPKQLDGVLEIEVARLRDRCDALRANPGGPPGPIKPLRIPPELSLDPWKPTDQRIYSAAPTSPATS